MAAYWRLADGDQARLQRLLDGLSEGGGRVRRDRDHVVVLAVGTEEALELLGARLSNCTVLQHDGPIPVPECCDVGSLFDASTPQLP